MQGYVWGPTYEEMLYPDRTAQRHNPLFGINWRRADGTVNHFILPKSITGVAADIAVLCGNHFPSGSHKVGAAYSILVEDQLHGIINPGQHLLFPSTGNFGIGGAWVGKMMNYKCSILMPPGVSSERFDKVRQYGAGVVEVDEDEADLMTLFRYCDEIIVSQGDDYHTVDQFTAFANYRFHYYVTGNTVAGLIERMRMQDRIANRVAFVSAMGSSGTIAAGDRLKQVFPGSITIQGIGDQQVNWIHNVMNMDAIMCIDENDVLAGWELFVTDEGQRFLTGELGVSPHIAGRLRTDLGLSSMCNILGAIKTAKYYGLSKDDLVVTVATDGFDRYRSVMADLIAEKGDLSPVKARLVLDSVFHGIRSDWVIEADRYMRRRWHNLKHYSWVKQRGMAVDDLQAQLSPGFWEKQQMMIPEIDRKVARLRDNA